VLLLLHGSCDCVSSKEAEFIVEPGGTRNLTAQLHTSGISGPLKVELRFETNDPSRLSLKLHLLAEISE